MGAQLGHNSLGEGEVDGGEIVGELRSPRWSWSTDGVSRGSCSQALRKHEG
jgi:hypothetical protein